MSSRVELIPGGLTIARILLETSKIAFVDARRFVDGDSIRLLDLDDDSAAAVQELELKTNADGTSSVVSVGLADKAAALETLMQYLSVDDAETLERIQAQVREILKTELARSGGAGVVH